MRGKNRKQEALNIPLLVVTLLVSAVFWVGIYGAARVLGLASKPVAVGVAFGVLLLVMMLAVFVMSLLMRTFRADVVTGKTGYGRIVLYMVLGLLVFSMLAAGLQYVYQSSLFVTRGAARDYVFVIDDSGSMETNDMYGERYRVINELLSAQPKSTKYAIYGFADETELLVPMQTVGEGLPQLSGSDYGLTFIKGALTRVMSDYEAGALDSDRLMVVLLTDGIANDLQEDYEVAELETLLQKYASKSIAVSTIGLSGNVDHDIMALIADSTGGQYVNVADASELGGAMDTAVGVSDVRNLLEMRTIGGAMYGVFRVLAVVLLGMLMTVMALICYGNSYGYMLTVISGGVKSLLAALVLELGTQLGMPPFAATWVMAVLLGTVVTCYGFSEEDYADYLNTKDPKRSSRRLGKQSSARGEIMDDFDW